MRTMQNRFSSIGKLLPRLEPEGERGADARRPRPRITSALMADRGVLRVLSAPTGFGKTTAMREYAEVVFDDRDVIWASFSDPALLCMLDEEGFGDATDLLLAFGEVAGCLLDEKYLFVFDDLCLLDEKRARVFSSGIDALLAAGQEVMIGTTPGNDCLSTLQPDRIVIDSRSLLVEPEEYLVGLVDGEGVGAALGGVGGGLADASFYESLGIPSLVWSAGEETASLMVRAFFSEGLPDAYLRPATMMLLMGSGSEADIEAMDVGATREVRAALTLHYPMLGYNVLNGRFRTLPASVDDIVPYADRGLLDWSGLGSPVEVAVDRLLARGEADRAVEIILGTCPHRELTSCLCRLGWRLIELGRVTCLREILDDLDAADIAATPELVLMDAWCRFLAGEHSNAACELLATGAMDTMPASLAPGRPRAAFLALRDLIAHDPGIAGIGVGPVTDPIAEIEEEYRSCAFECLARSDEGDGEGIPPCGLPMESRRACCGWRLIMGCMLEAGEQEGIGGHAHDGRPQAMKDVLVRVPLSFQGFGYNLALHIAAASVADRCAGGDIPEGAVAGPAESTQADGEEVPEEGRIGSTTSAEDASGEVADLRRTLDALLTQDVTRIVATDMMTPDRAVLVLDQVTIGTGCGDGNIDLRRLRAACTRSAGVLRDMDDLLVYLAEILPELSLDDHLGLPAVPTLDGQGKLVPDPRALLRRELPHGETSPERTGVEAPHEHLVVVGEGGIPTMEIGLFGGFRLSFDGKVPPTTEWRKRNVRYLIAILTLARGNWVSREAILERIWPGISYERARDSFYTTWRHVRHLCGSTEEGERYLTRTDICCRIEMEHVSCDVLDFSAAVRESVGMSIDDPHLMDIAHRLERLYVDDLLNDDYLDGAIDGERVRLRTQFTEAMLKASNAETRHGDSPAALWFAQQAYERGETSERVYRELMLALVQEKRYAEAIRMGDECAEYLRDEIGLGLSKETSEVYERAVYLLRHGRQRMNTRSTSPLPKENTRKEPLHNAK